jgi:Bacterial SH3 domain
MTSRASLWLFTLALATPAAHAEPVYVIEQLVVSITSEPGSEAERIGQVKSGDKLELIEREGEEAHVRLPSGKEGWIKGSYVSSEEPLQVRLTERTAEVEKLKQEGDKLRQDVSRLQTELASARRAPAVTPANAPGAGAETGSGAPKSGAGSSSNAAAGSSTAGGHSRTAAESGAAAGSSMASSSGASADSANPEVTPAPIRETVFLRSPDRPGQTSWAFILGICAVMLLVGFVLGWKTLDRRIRQKYGGLRIY